jgi:hypothetical protein
MKKGNVVFFCIAFIISFQITVSAANTITDNLPNVNVDITQKYTKALQKYNEFKDSEKLATIKPEVTRYAKNLVNTLVVGVKQELTGELADPLNGTSGSKVTLGTIKNMFSKTQSFFEECKNPSEWIAPLKQNLNKSVNDYGAAMHAVYQGKNIDTVTKSFLKSFDGLYLSGDIQGQLRSLTTQHFQDVLQTLNKSPNTASTNDGSAASWLKIPFFNKTGQS